MKKRLRWLLTGALVTIIIAGCSPDSSLPSPETAPTRALDPTASEIAAIAAVKAVAEAEATVQSNQSLNGSSTLDETGPMLASGSALSLATTIPKTTPVVQEEVISVPIRPPIPGPENPAVQGLIRQAKEDLAQRLSIQTEKIDLISFELMVWPDPGLGCPHPDINYIQVPTEGYLIVLRAGDRLYNYHGGGSGDQPPFLCEKFTGEKDISPPPGPGVDQ